MKRRELNAPDWLTARPIAHRGLHSKRPGLIENTPAAAAAAVAKNYAIECDVQRSEEGEAVVFHDFTLDRLTLSQGRVDALTAHALGQLAYRECEDKIASLSQFLAAIGGRVPAVIEIKSRYDGDMRLAERALSIVSAYSGPACLKSFDPAILVHLRKAGAACPLGLVAQARYDDEEWAPLPHEQRKSFERSQGLSTRATGFPVLEFWRSPACRAFAVQAGDRHAGHDMDHTFAAGSPARPIVGRSNHIRGVRAVQLRRMIVPL